MATASTVQPIADCVAIEDIFNSFVECVATDNKENGAVPADSHSYQVEQDEVNIRWLRPTMDAICCLRSAHENLPDGRKATQPKAVANLLWLLARVLEKETIPPTSIIPTWRGGVTAEWHVNGFDLEIESDPDGAIEYNFAGPSVDEYEGPVGESLHRLRRHVSMLPPNRE
jgi:hypothetical protein